MRKIKFTKAALAIIEEKFEKIRVKQYNDEKTEQYIVLRTIISTLKFILGMQVTITGANASPCLSESSVNYRLSKGGKHV